MRSISGQSNARRYRNVLRCRLNVTRVDELLTEVGRLFQIVGADTRKAANQTSSNEQLTREHWIQHITFAAKTKAVCS